MNNIIKQENEKKKNKHETRIIMSSYDNFSSTIEKLGVCTWSYINKI